MNSKTRPFAVAAALAILLGAGVPRARPLTESRAPAAPTLRDLQSLDEPKARFNRDRSRASHAAPLTDARVIHRWDEGKLIGWNGLIL